MDNCIEIHLKFVAINLSEMSFLENIQYSAQSASSSRRLCEYDIENKR